ncbi:MAG: VOC family protein [Parvibaculaceae bacterium]|nr:VOC family protein [Parvibaculaceae bacterium]
MLDHIGLGVTDYGAGKEFYTKALAPLDYTPIWESPAEDGIGGHAGFGAGEKPDFWIGQGMPAPGLHVAFLAKSRAAVDAFYKAAIAAGGRDNGKPGLRPHYHENYYAAFVFDAGGHNIEAVCYNPE